jgi:formylglycine-generating enzyme required for sulfatase activity
MRGPREEFASVWTEVSPHFDLVGLGTLRLFDDWYWKRRGLTSELAAAAAGKGARADWLRLVLTPARERLFEGVLDAATHSGSASEFARGCGRWFAALGWSDSELMLRTGRVFRAAAETLLTAGQLAQCLQVVEEARLLKPDAENGLAELRARLFVWAAICNHGPGGLSAQRATVAREALKPIATSEGLEAFELLLSWAKRSGASTAGSPVPALDAVLQAGEGRRLFADALRGRSRELADALRNAAGRFPDAKRFDGPVEDWLELIGGATEMAEDLRGRAFAVLHREREHEVAMRVAALMKSKPPRIEPSQQPSVATSPAPELGHGQSNQAQREVDELIEMIHVKAGSFVMGSPRSEVGRDDDEVQHEVLLTRNFELSRYPVTNALFRSVMGKGDFLSDLQGPTAPVVSVSWYSAVGFCNRMSALHGYAPAYRIEGKQVNCDFASSGFRLPTEAEWEYACRAGTVGSRYGELDRVAWYAGSVSGLPFPVAVGQKAPNDWGFHDMLGNVWEWVWDWYGPMTASQAVNPTGPSRGTARVWRGGAVAEQPRKVRAAFRSGPPPDLEAHILGFRVARTVV